MSTVIEHHMVVIEELLVSFVLCALEIVSDNLKNEWQPQSEVIQWYK